MCTHTQGFPFENKNVVWLKMLLRNWRPTQAALKFDRSFNIRKFNFLKNVKVWFDSCQQLLKCAFPQLDNPVAILKEIARVTFIAQPPHRVQSTI